MSNAVAASVAAQSALAVYFQLVEWAPLFPWNDVRHGNEQRRLDLLIGAVQAGFIVWVAGGSRWAAIVAAASYALWLALQIRGWWIPYMRGASAQGVAFYDAHFGATVKLLARRHSDRPPPDANHVVLQVLILAAVITSCLAVASPG